MHVAKKYHSCKKCNKTFHREHNKVLHERHCNKPEYCHPNSLKRKLANDFHQPHKKKKSNYTICVTKSAFKNAVITYTIKYNDDENPFLREVSKSVDAMSSKIINFQKEKQSFKI